MRHIPGCPGYAITETGKVRSKRRQGAKGKWLKPYHGVRSEHLSVMLRIDGYSVNKLVHRLVLETYVGPCPKGMECRHLDGDPTNNQLSNLRWGTHVENMKDMVKHGTSPKSWLGKFGEKHHSSRLSNKDRQLIFHVYHIGGYTQQELADQFDVSQCHIGRIVNNKRWSK